MMEPVAHANFVARSLQVAWLREVQDEIRNGRLSINNYNFLHGRDTTVPGRWCAGVAQCKNPVCQKLGERIERSGSKRQALERAMHEQEQTCERCRHERASKARVALTPADMSTTMSKVNQTKTIECQRSCLKWLSCSSRAKTGISRG